MTNYNRGVVKEREIQEILEAAGYETARTAGSHGCFDVVGIGPTGVRLIQSKRCKAGGKWQADFDLAVEKMQALPKLPNVSREVWVWMDGTGWIKREVV